MAKDPRLIGGAARNTFGVISSIEGCDTLGYHRAIEQTHMRVVETAEPD
ncbi:MAG: hypothetical protein AAF671_13200 [Pseudomonadota bacterium]